MSSLPKVSVVTPSYNQAGYLEQTIRSVLDQQGASVEYFVYDGGSADGSQEIIRRYADRLAGWVSEPDRGQADAINKGWVCATGEVLGWLNSDDIYWPGALRRVTEEFAAHPEMQILAGDCLFLDADGRVLGTKVARDIEPVRLLTTGGNVPGQPAVFIRRSVFETVGPLRTDLHYLLDFDYWFRISRRYSMDRMRSIHVPLAASRYWPATKTLTGGKAICDENRRWLDDCFANGSLPPEYQARREEAYAGTYWKQASLEWQASQGRQARLSARAAGRRDPTTYPGDRVLRFWLVSWLPYRFAPVARRLWSRMRGRLPDDWIGLRV